MAGGNKVFNIALGKVRWYAEQVGVGNAAFVLLLLKNSGLETDATLLDHDNVSVMLAAANDEADFTNYVRKTITSVTISNPDTDESLEISFADQSYGNVGGAANNTLGKAVVAFDPDTTTGSDTTLVPILAFNITYTTDGNALNIRNPSGLLQATSS
jgi:hypothetical protein